MSDVAAAPAAAPNPTNGAAPPPAAAPAPSGPIHAGNDYADFQAQISERAKARGVNQPPAPPKTVQPQPKGPGAPAINGDVQGQTLEDSGPAKKLDGTELEPPPVTEAPANPHPEGEAGLPAGITPDDLALLEKAKAWMASDEVPEEFLKKLVKLKNGDSHEFETFEEYQEQRMRQRDFTRNMQEMDRERAQYKENLGFYEGHFQAIFDDANDGAAGGEAMYEIYSRAGKRKQLLALGRKLAGEEQEDIDGANGIGLAIMQRMKIQDPRDHRVQDAIKKEFERRQAMRDGSARTKSLEYENQRLKKLSQQRELEAQNMQQGNTAKKQLEQLRPRAFQALGLDHADPIQLQDFQEYLHAIIRQEGAEKLTPQLVMKAARCVLDRLKKQGAGNGNGQAPRQHQGFQPQLGAGGGPISGAKKTEQWHSDSFAEKFGMPKW